MQHPTINNVPVHQVAHIYAEQDFEFLYDQLVEWSSLDVRDYDDEFSLPMYEAMRITWEQEDERWQRRRWYRPEDRRVRDMGKRKEVK